MSLKILRPCAVQLVSNLRKNNADVICLIDRNTTDEELTEELKQLSLRDKAFDKTVHCLNSVKLNQSIVYSPLPEWTDYSDVRGYQRSAAGALERAIKGGFKAPLLVIPRSNKFANAEICSILGALQELYVPISFREDVPEKKQRVDTLSLFIDNPKAKEVLQEALVLESGRFVARDIGGSDPERMTPQLIKDYIVNLSTSLKIDVHADEALLNKEYPLFAAVNRAANEIPRHRGCVVYLEYQAPKPAKKTLLLVGKGVTFDSGGANIKTGGSLLSMSRDKCGAAAVAGFMQVVNELKPDDVHVIAALCLVRNSIGENAYVPDEIITSRAGQRVRVTNTDAEGRFAMSDVLCRLKERALEENLPDPHLFTVSTLTGHAMNCVGEGYSIAVDNSVAKAAGHASRLANIGNEFGDPIEISNLREDDFDINKGEVVGEDLLQTPSKCAGRRGHQYATAFMIQASGLDKHGLSSETPLKYTQLDIAGSAVPNFPKAPTAAPMLALVKTHLN